MQHIIDICNKLNISPPFSLDDVLKYADATGKTYGYAKLDLEKIHVPEAPKNKKPNDELKHICKYYKCQKVFYPTNKRQKFCSVNCKNNHHYIRKGYDNVQSK